MKTTKEEKAEAVAFLKSIGVVKGSEIYSYVRSVSSSGMSRQIKFLFPTVRQHGENFGENAKPEIVDITRHVAIINGSRFNKDKWVIVAQGCGMDMCFNEVYNLASNLWRDEKGEHDGKTDAGYWLKSANLK